MRFLYYIKGRLKPGASVLFSLSNFYIEPCRERKKGCVGLVKSIYNKTCYQMATASYLPKRG
jgi:hypothetical protein